MAKKVTRDLPHLDSEESVFFQRELDHVKARSYDVRYPDYKAMYFIPVSREAGPGDETITYYQYDMVGMAKIIADYADDLPRADVKGKAFTSKIKGVGASYSYSLPEIRAAATAGKPLSQMRANAAKKAVLARLDAIARNGDSGHGLYGLFTHPNVPDVAIAADGTGSSALWTAKTPELIIRDLNALVAEVVEGTNGYEKPNTLLLSLGAYNHISTRQMTSIDKTVLKFFLENSPYIKSVEVWEQLQGAGAGGTDLMWCYKKDPEVLTLEIPQDFEQLPVQPKGLAFEVPCHARTGGVIIYYPLAMAKADGHWTAA